MTAKLTRLAHRIAIQLHLVAESCTICSSRSRRPVRKLLDNPRTAIQPLKMLLRRVYIMYDLRPADHSDGTPFMWITRAVDYGVLRTCRLVMKILLHPVAIDVWRAVYRTNYRSNILWLNCYYTVRYDGVLMKVVHRFSEDWWQGLMVSTRLDYHPHHTNKSDISTRIFRRPEIWYFQSSGDSSSSGLWRHRTVEYLRYYHNTTQHHNQKNNLNFRRQVNLWPPRSPDHPGPYFYLYGPLKGRVYDNNPHSIEELNRRYSFKHWS
jgi:hypothetical protein